MGDWWLQASFTALPNMALHLEPTQEIAKTLDPQLSLSQVVAALVSALCSEIYWVMLLASFKLPS